MTEEADEDPRNINILESEGQHEVGGPNVEILDISQLMRTKQVNIGLQSQELPSSELPTSSHPSLPYFYSLKSEHW